MPLYEYICMDCGYRFDALRSIKDADQPLTCSQCSGQHTTRQISVFFAQSGGRVIAGGHSHGDGGGCAGCSGGSCSTCGQ